MKPARLLAAAAGRLRRNPEIILIALSATLAVAPFGQLYATQHYLVLVALAAVVVIGVALLCPPNLPLPVVIAVSAGWIFIYMAVFVFHTSRPAAVWNGLTGSWSALLTATLPAVGSAANIALPVLLTAAATLVAVEIALRSRWKTGPVIPPIGALVVALLFTGKRPLPSPLVIAALVFLLLLTVFVRVRSAHVSESGAETGTEPVVDGGVRTGISSGLPMVMVILILATGLGVALPVTSTSHRVDLRARYNAPIQISQAITPLAMVQSQLNSQSTAPLFTVRFRGVPSGMKIDRVPIAVLNTYDGSVWGTNASFAPARSELPTGPSPAQPGPVVQQDYELGGYGLSFLPALARPIRATGNGLVFDRAYGDLATPTPAGPGFTYSVDSVMPDQSRVAFEPVKPGNDPTFATLAAAPQQGWPSEMSSFADQFAGKSPYATLESIVQELRSKDFGYNKSARPGQSLGVLSTFLTAPTSSSDARTARVGFSEQFAAAFAAIARIKGFPSVVIVGYRLSATDAAKGVPIAVLPQDIYAWAEVELNGIGWVTFDPTNTTPRNSTVPLSTPPPPPPPPISEPSPGSQPTNIIPLRSSGPHTASPWWIVVLMAGVICAPALVVGSKILRRHRRARHGTTTARVVGAWRESRERLRSHGATVSQAMTVDEAARTAGATMGDDAASRVRAFEPVLNTALFAPAEPDEETAREAWEAEASLRALLNEQSSTLQRVLAALDPRPLVGIAGRNSR